MKKIVLSAVLLVVSALAQAAAPVAKIQAMLAKPEVLCGRFDQTKHLAGMKKPLASNGRFCVVAGKGILWRTLKPFPNTLRLTRDEIVHFQGERVAMRLEAKNEPVVRMINSVLFSLLGGDLAQLDKLFEVEGTADAASWQVALKAREPGLAKAIGAISLEGGAYVKNIVMNEASGDKTVIVFSAMQTGAAALTAEEAALF
ncbi:outer membrane lipoprotein carrier protein LolA [Massilia sp. MB5]|uniref:outer membrane lipoprotein carrier protein LolA n=1 Tax=Massilia sp. MB5 TaxID=2919578 RepID=UPI001F0E027B|nr:outer membrane lipoprotein carrier protein LolA [Massilia sp. MB5]UMR30531.1 outer membrane lipoprotein carrier protein LolA [Massilia sp. MB5]